MKIKEVTFVTNTKNISTTFANNKVKMKTRILLLLFFSIMLTGCFCKKEQKQEKALLLSPTEFNLKKENHLLIDVRTPAEFEESHLKNAIHIDYFDTSFYDKVKNFGKNKPIFIYCRSGRKSGEISKKLIKKGFTKVYDLEGGIISWKEQQNEVIKP